MRGDETCYVLFRRDRRKGIPLFASFIYVSDPTLFRAMGGHVRRHLLLRHRIPFTLSRAQRRRVTPRLSVMLDSPRPKMYRSPTLGAGQTSTTCTASSPVSFGEPVDETTGHAMMSTQLHHLLEERARTHEGDAGAHVQGGDTRSYAELWDRCTAFAAGLARARARARTSASAIFLDKRIETVESIFGASAAGGVFVPINPLLKAQQVAYILDDCGVRVLVTTAERLDAARATSSRRARLSSTSSSSATTLPRRRPRACQLHAWRGDFARAGADRRARRRSTRHGGDPLHVGEHRASRRASCSRHRNLIVGGESVSHYLGNTADDVILAALPLSFDAGFSQLTTAFTVGAHVVLMNYLLARRRRPAVRASTGSPA